MRPREYTLWDERIVCIIFADQKLLALYTHGQGAQKWPKPIGSTFLRRVRHIEAAQDEQDLRIPPSVHYEQLKGTYAGKTSLRLTRQWRLIISIRHDDAGRYVVIHEITNHYGD